MNSAEKHLVWFLRFSALMFLSAAFAVVLPTAWMSAINDRLGLGPFADVPLMQYLARSESLLYAMIGASCWFMSNDVRRYLPLLRFTVPLMVVFDVTIIALDVQFAMPLLWTVGEAVSLIAWTLLLWWLVRRLAD